MASNIEAATRTLINPEALLVLSRSAANVSAMNLTLILDEEKMLAKYFCA
jgi:hypothetical protein